MKTTVLAFLCAAAALGSLPRPADERIVDYTFQNPPINARGVTSMADLRGKPVLIDFWGTR